MSKDLRAFTPVVHNGEKILIPTVFLEISQLRATKSADYNGSVNLKEYFPFGLTSYAQMLWVKTLRLRSLIETKSTPNHESLRDTLKDLINYACYAIEDIDGTLEGSPVEPISKFCVPGGAWSPERGPEK